MFFRRNKPRTEENTPASPSDGAPRATSADASVASDSIETHTAAPHYLFSCTRRPRAAAILSDSYPLYSKRNL